MKKHWAHRIIRYSFWNLYCNYLQKIDFQSLLILKNMPNNIADWQVVMEKCYKPILHILIFLYVHSLI